MRDQCNTSPRSARFRSALLVLTIMAAWCVCAKDANAVSVPRSSETPNPPTIITFSIISAAHGARILHAVYPHAAIRVEGGANAVVVIASPDDVAGMRTIATGIDVRNPTRPVVDTVQVHNARPVDVVQRVKPMFSHSRFSIAPNDTLVVSASTPDMTQIKAVIAAIDTPPAPPTPRPTYEPQAVNVTQADPRALARAVARSERGLRVATSGSQIVFSGPPDAEMAAKALITQLDQPGPGVQYTQLYRLHFVDAGSVADLLQRSFAGLNLQVDKDLNAVTVLAPATRQYRVADAIAQLDAAPTSSGGSPTGPPGGGQQTSEVIFLRAAVPAIGGAASTSAADVAQSVSQALSGSAPDLKITVHPNSTRLILTGSSYSISLAKNLIAQLDTPEPLVELDTEVYEIDESIQKQLGLKFPTAVLSTTYSELTPSTTTAAGVTNQPLKLSGLTRTPLSLQAQLDFLVSSNKARILEDPRITTFSGRTASIHAGETVNILTTTGGGTGTVATTQVQSFQTGVTLDITPVVNSDDYVTVSLHPSVNTVAGISTAGVPNIQTRDTTTTVGLHDGETLVVGGLIEDSDSRTTQKIPFLGDIPLLGKLFQDTGVTHSRNEVVVTVTPRIIHPAAALSRNRPFSVPPLPSTPEPLALPTLEAQATVPPQRAGRTLRVPTPLNTPPAAIAPSDATTPTPSPLAGQPAPAASPSIAPSAGANPAPLPSAFEQTNTFTFGSAPSNNYASASSAPQIYFVQVQPTVVKNGQPITIAAITTTNVSALSFGPSPTSPQTTLGSVAPGKWQSTFNFSAASLPTISGNVVLTLTATTTLGANTTVKIPFTITQ